MLTYARLSPTIDEPASDDWLGEIQIRDHVLTRLQVTRAVCIGLPLMATGLIGFIVITDSSPARTAATLAILTIALLGFRPAPHLALKLICLPVDRTRWVGCHCHLAVTPGGVLVTTAFDAEFLPWEAMRGVVPHPLTPTQTHPAIFLSIEKHSEIGRSYWRYRPDIADAVGFHPPLSDVYLPPRNDVEVTYYGELSSETGGEQVVSVPVAACGTVTVETRNNTSVRVHGPGIPTVEINRIGPVDNDHVPIGTTDPAALHLRVDEIDVHLVEVVRDRFSMIPHQLVVADGFGDVVRLVADEHTRSQKMFVFRGVRNWHLPLWLTRHDDGRIDVTTPKTWVGTDAPTPGELALAVALAAAPGTRSVNLRNVPGSVVDNLLDGLGGSGGS